jgi:NitT/TauT family transport system substrate-binding protein
MTSTLALNAKEQLTTRRNWLMHMATGALLSPLFAPSISRAQRPTKRLRLLLNTGFSSPQAWLWQALAQGYLAAEGIELDLTPGAGAYTAAPRMLDGNYDLAYGDVNSLIDVCAKRPETAPRGVYMMFNASPSCVLVAADGPIRHPRDLVGQRLIGHDSDVALRTFGALCHAQGIDPRAIQVDSAWAGMTGMAEDVVAGRAAGAFGYVSTFTGSIVSANPQLLKRVRFLRYADWAPDLYGSVLMASQRLLREEPDVVTRVVRALNRGVMDLMRQPEPAFESVMRAHPGLPRAAERARLQATLDLEMNPELPAGHRQTGLGDIDVPRLERGIALMMRGSALPRTPGAQEIFTAAHLPPASARALA